MQVLAHQRRVGGCVDRYADVAIVFAGLNVELVQADGRDTCHSAQPGLLLSSERQAAASCAHGGCGDGDGEIVDGVGGHVVHHPFGNVFDQNVPMSQKIIMLKYCKKKKNLD